MSFSLGKRFIATIILAVVCNILLGVLYWWLYIYVSGARMSLSKVKSDIASSGEDRKAVRAADLIFAERKDDLARIEKFFIDSKQPVDFIESLENLARATRNQITLSVDSGIREQRMLAFRLSLDGSKENLLRYLALLELLPYEIHVDEISLQRAEGFEAGAAVGQSGTSPAHRLSLLFRVKTK